MPYSLQKFDKQVFADNSHVYVALVKKEGVVQPFRVQLEHFESTEDAMKQVNEWIAVQEEDDARAEVNKEREETEASQENIINELNQAL